MPATSVRIGCAGWSIPGRHAALTGEGESMLARYATRFPVVEINSSFYRPHQQRTYERWAASVPAAFRFSVKLPKAISHEAALRGCGPALDRFLEQTAGLGRTLGGLLLQLPPSHAFDARVAAGFFGMLRRRTDVRVVCEPRHASWFGPQADALLQRHAIGRVGADPARVPEAAQPGGDARWRYWRWHGAPRMYYSAYDDAALHAVARTVAARTGGARWVIFDNTAHGFAIANAARLQDILSGAALQEPGHA
ncbi:DUF72 domain-containing protein [Stenotrophomonas rhizophila]